MTHDAPVTVGVDGSECALVAAEWAARQAALIGRPLRAVHAFEWPMFNVRITPPPGAPAWAGLSNEARRIVREAVERAGAAAPGAAVDGEVVDGFRLPVLFREAARAHCVVVGTHGLGGVGALLVGSAGLELIAHGACPVVVVPDTPASAAGGPLVAAVDCSESSRGALDFALAQAKARGTGLRVVMAWRPSPVHAAVDPQQVPADQEPRVETAHARLRAFTEPARRRHPEVAVDEDVVQGGARRVLIAASAEAGLLVVGSRGYGGFHGLMVGSVSQGVVHQAKCPVAVVPPTG